ncbi:hypothetical protein [Cytobacillus gottheilii]|uniref:Uncharacterized protein n=1 Tax=Cytobacillus gottheilii TaxID=859144 RepID=A0ABX8FIW3_9BACI|nr:hypothetical protein [Cytobacillus gottheilii]QVY63978.1 hypothetical protein J1899_22330 [Cytobacillus gottheilii]
MITCPYCATSLRIMDAGPFKDHAECTFCQVLLGPESEHGMYAQNGARMPHIKQKPMITIADAEKPLYELKKLHTIDLILCLKEARLKRADLYNLVRTFNVAVDGLKSDSSKDSEVQQYSQVADEQGKEYEYWTRKCWCIENLLIERLGYFPQKINDLLYSKFITNKERSINKAMKISRSRNEKNVK